MTGVERVRAATHGPAVFRSRVLLHYKRKDIGLSGLPRLAMSDGNAVAESLTSHLVSKDDTPGDSFVGGTIIRLREPRHIDDKDDRSPIVVGYVVVGAEGSDLFVGSLVTVAQVVGRWRILTMGDTMVAISQDRSVPYRRDIALDDVTEQLA